MKYEILKNYDRAKGLECNQAAKEFKMDGDDANPYMIIHQD